MSETAATLEHPFGPRASIQATPTPTPNPVPERVETTQTPIINPPTAGLNPTTTNPDPAVSMDRKCHPDRTLNQESTPTTPPTPSKAPTASALLDQYKTLHLTINDDDYLRGLAKNVVVTGNLTLEQAQDHIQTFASNEALRRLQAWTADVRATVAHLTERRALLHTQHQRLETEKVALPRFLFQLVPLQTPPWNPLSRMQFTLILLAWGILAAYGTMSIFLTLTANVIAFMDAPLGAGIFGVAVVVSSFSLKAYYHSLPTETEQQQCYRRMLHVCLGAIALFLPLFAMTTFVAPSDAGFGSMGSTGSTELNGLGGLDGSYGSGSLSGSGGSGFLASLSLATLRDFLASDFMKAITFALQLTFEFLLSGILLIFAEKLYRENGTKRTITLSVTNPHRKAITTEQEQVSMRIAHLNREAHLLESALKQTHQTMDEHVEKCLLRFFDHLDELEDEEEMEDESGEDPEDKEEAGPWRETGHDDDDGNGLHADRGFDLDSHPDRNRDHPHSLNHDRNQNHGHNHSHHHDGDHDHGHDSNLNLNDRRDLHPDHGDPGRGNVNGGNAQFNLDDELFGLGKAFESESEFLSMRTG